MMMPSLPVVDRQRCFAQPAAARTPACGIASETAGNRHARFGRHADLRRCEQQAAGSWPRLRQAYRETREALFPSGSAALYRRAMLDEIGGFDGDFFLYCEDTDLGLRAVWAGWKCFMSPDAIVEHRYSHSAGRASALKAYLVERNRLYVAIKNFPSGMLLKVPFVSLKRYFWHLLFLFRGQGKAAEFASEGGGARLAWFVIRAHVAAAIALPLLLAKRRRIRSRARDQRR